MVLGTSGASNNFTVDIESWALGIYEIACLGGYYIVRKTSTGGDFVLMYPPTASIDGTQLTVPTAGYYRTVKMRPIIKSAS